MQRNVLRNRNSKRLPGRDRKLFLLLSPGYYPNLFEVSPPSTFAPHCMVVGCLFGCINRYHVILTSPLLNYVVEQLRSQVIGHLRPLFPSSMFMNLLGI